MDQQMQQRNPQAYSSQQQQQMKFQQQQLYKQERLYNHHFQSDARLVNAVIPTLKTSMQVMLSFNMILEHMGYDQSIYSQQSHQGGVPPQGYTQQQMQQQQNQLVSPLDIRGLTQRISSKEVLDSKVEQILSQISEDFVKNVAEFACKLAKHRGSDTLEKEDIKFAIEKLYNIPTPIKPSSDRQVQSSQVLSSASLVQASTSNYKQNLLLVKKANDQNMGGNQ